MAQPEGECRYGRNYTKSTRSGVKWRLEDSKISDVHVMLYIVGAEDR